MKINTILLCIFFAYTHMLFSADITGELKKWHKITLSFKGPQTSETATPNPFLDYRLDVTFQNGDSTYLVPGYFAADGDAANTSETEGNIWRVHFCPDAEGEWNYTVSFRQGDDVAISDTTDSGTAYEALDGETGSFVVGPTDKETPDLRAKGRLKYVGARYLKFAETGEYFLKQGADAPENFLAYEDFDNTPNNGNYRKSWSPHTGDWQTGDPSWGNGKGTEIIGAINYLSSEEMNAFSFIPMNINGDDKNVFPYISDEAADRTRFDCSKLDQWEIVFDHGQKMGMFLHFKTQETENELLLDNGNLGTERKLYYRELIARFGHHLALNWNLGEEINNATTAQKKAWAQYFFDHDPYHHHIIIHNGASHFDLLGPGSKLTGFSLQTNNADFRNVHSRVQEYLNRSENAGKIWAVACDEPGDASHALRPDNDAGNSHEDGRKNGIWGTFMAGGWGNEWYFGYAHAHSDLSCQDFRSRDLWWDECRIALHYFKDRHIPFWEMISSDDLASGSNNWCLAKDGEDIVVYAKEGGKVSVNLSQWTIALHTVEWFDPRTGKSNIGKAVQGGGTVELNPAPPYDTEFAARIYPVEDATPPTAPAGLDAEATGEREIKLTWQEASDENSGIGAYIIYRNGEQVALVASSILEYADSSLTHSTTYNYFVTAINGSGIEGDAAGPVSVSTLEDQTDPELIEARALSSTSVNLQFSEELLQESATNIANYAITPGIEIQNADLSGDMKSVTLTTSAHEKKVTYEITVSNIQDLAGRLISSRANSASYTFISNELWFFAEDANPANGAALQIESGSLGGQVAYCPSANSSLTFTVNIEIAGVWYAWGRFLFKGSGNDPNSFYLQADNGEELKFGNNKDFFNVWHWDGDGNIEGGDTEPLSIGTLSEGEHTLTITCREPLGDPGTSNVIIDMLYLTTKENVKPEDDSVPEQTFIETPHASQPTQYKLCNYPNPFNPVTRIEYTIPRGGMVCLKVYDLSGRGVKTLVNKNQEAGSYHIQFDAGELASGAYLYQLEMGNFRLVRKLMFLK